MIAGIICAVVTGPWPRDHHSDDGKQYIFDRAALLPLLVLDRLTTKESFRINETDRPEPAEAILELILRFEQEASKARRQLRKSLRRLGIDPEMTMAQLGERLLALGAEAPPLIGRPDYEVRVIPPVDPRGLLHVRVKAGLAHQHGAEDVLMVPLETATQDEEAERAAAAAFGFYRSVYACPRCGERVTVALLHEQWPH